METQSSGLSIASMVCGICALVFTCCIPYVPQILGILGVIFAGVSLSKHMGGKGMAIAGLVCSLIALAIYAIALITGSSAPATIPTLPAFVAQAAATPARYPVWVRLRPNSWIFG